MVQLRHIARFAYGEALAGQDRADGVVPVYGSNGQVGWHDRPNTAAPALVIGRKGSHGKVNYCSCAIFAIDTTFYIDATTCGQDLRWLAYALTTIGLEELSHDVGVPGLSREAAYGIRIPCPPRNQQEAIADFLDAETARIDALIAKKRRLIELLDERLSGLVNYVVWDATDGVIPLMRVTQPRRPIMYGIVLPGPDVGMGIPIVKGGDVAPGRLRRELLACTTAEIEAPYARARLMPRDLVFAIRGGIGDVEIVPPELDGANITQDVARVAPAEYVDAEWLKFVLCSRHVQRQVAERTTGATIRGLNIWELKRINIPMSDSQRQAEDLERLRVVATDCSRLTDALTQQISLLTERRQALITAAVAGGMGVPGVAA